MSPANGLNPPEPGRAASTDPLPAQQRGANRTTAPAGDAENTATDMRVEKIARLRAAIQAGTYYVSAIAFAEKIMQGMLGWNRYQSGLGSK